MIYHDRLELTRSDNDYTKRKIADILGLAKDSYGQYENEKSIIPIKHLNKLSNLLDVSFDYLFNFTNTKKYNNSRNNIDLKLLSNRLIELRKNHKLSQRRLAEKLNTSSGRIANYELMTNTITTKILYTICSTYHISADYLLGKIDKPKTWP